MAQNHADTLISLEVVSAAMPTYDYSCRSCGARFEAWQKMTDDPITICPTCGGPVRRIIYPVGLVFKGSGFYSTDNHRPVATASDSSDGAGDAGKDTAAAAASKPAASAAADTASGSGSGVKRSGAADASSKPATSAAATPATSAKG